MLVIIDFLTILILEKIYKSVLAYFTADRKTFWSISISHREDVIGIIESIRRLLISHLVRFTLKFQLTKFDEKMKVAIHWFDIERMR